MWFLLATLVSASLATPANAQLPCSYNVTVLPNEPCFGRQSPANPIAINNLGHVLLVASQCLKGYDVTYIWTGGPTLTPIQYAPNMVGFHGNDLNDHDVIVGTAMMTYAGQRGFMYDLNTGVWTELPPLNPPTGWSSANAINNNNEVTGFRSIGNASGPINPRTAFRWSAQRGFENFGMPDGRSTEGFDIDAAGTVSVSSGQAAPGAFAYLWFADSSSMIQPPGCLNSEGGRLNDLGLLTTGGLTDISSTTEIGFTYRNGVFTPLNPLPGATSASFLGLTSSGLICGRSNFPGSNWRACAWTKSQPVDLNSLLPVGFNGTLREAYVSGNGNVISTALMNNGSSKAVKLTPVLPSLGDTNCDGRVDIDDVLQVISVWGPCAGCRADQNGDMDVNVRDLISILLHWSPA